MNDPAAIATVDLTHHYGQRCALSTLTLNVRRGELLAILGPNGGGKTTLFRLLSTLVAPQQGQARVLGFDLLRQAGEIRRRIGIVFQAPSLDKKLTVLENIRHQAALYGLWGTELKRRQQEMLERLGIADRAHEKTEKLSGGLRRRVELAKGMIHRPELLLLDEPSTGLDPAARGDLHKYLAEARAAFGVTVVLTTHLLEEAEKVDRIAILDRGKLVAIDTPANLRAEVGGDSIQIETENASALAQAIAEKFNVPAQVIEGRVRLEQPRGHEWIPKLVEAFSGQIRAVTLGKPTLEDVFIAKTGHRFWQREGNHDAA